VDKYDPFFITKKFRKLFNRFIYEDLSFQDLLKLCFGAGLEWFKSID